MHFYYLEMTRGSEIGKRFPLTDGAVSIGRSSQNNISLPSVEKSVSGHHAIVYKSPERILIQDLQSTNGTYVNDIKINEKELSPGDEIGFGKAGPRLKLIESEKELSAGQKGQAQQSSPMSTRAKTIDDGSRPFFTPSQDTTSNEPLDTVTKVKLEMPLTDASLGRPSRTTEYEQKLVDNAINSSEMKDLMKDGKRMEKILEHGKLGEEQTSMLRTVYNANKAMRTQWMYILGGVVFVSLCVCLFFGIRAFQYKHIIDKAQSLRKDLDEYDKKIAVAKSDPQANETKLKQLIAEMEKRENDFQQVQSRIDENDVGKVYTDPLERSIDQILRRFGESEYHIPREMIERVRFHINEYSSGLHDAVSRYIQRKEKYLPMIQKIFREKNIPVELSYVAMLESGFNPMALSHAGARGLWQFMPETGKRYGLMVTDALDERTLPEKSTYAAAQYFKELISIFGGKSSVMLCMAAYNAGEGRIIGALRKIDDPMHNRDFWYIYRMGFLAEETNEYIPRMLALLIISENPQQFGFTPSATSTTASLSAENDFVEVDFRVK
jgi:hypothetical protein